MREEPGLHGETLYQETKWINNKVTMGKMTLETIQGLWGQMGPVSQSRLSATQSESVRAMAAPGLLTSLLWGSERPWGPHPQRTHLRSGKARGRHHELSDYLFVVASTGRDVTS